MSYKSHKPHNFSNQQGMSLLLAVLLLSSLTIVTLVMSDIVLRVARTSRGIGHSEIAYYAAETAVEKAIYDIERDRDLTGLDVTSPQTLTDSGGSWTRTVTMLNEVTTDCDDIGSQEGICVDDPSEGITPSNPLEVQLNDGSSFQIEFDFEGLAFANNLNITWSGAPSTFKVIVFNRLDNSQSIEGKTSLNNLSDNLYLVRVINQSGSQKIFNLQPSAAVLPIGIKITGTGTYLNEERILEVERKNWQIY